MAGPWLWVGWVRTSSLAASFSSTTSGRMCGGCFLQWPRHATMPSHTWLVASSTLQVGTLPRVSVWAFFQTSSHGGVLLEGGRQCKRPVKAFEAYDTETRSWTSLPALPCKRTYAGVLWDPDGRLCLLGGLRQGGGHQSSKFTKNINVFDTNQGTETDATRRITQLLLWHQRLLEKVK